MGQHPGSVADVWQSATFSWFLLEVLHYKRSQILEVPMYCPSCGSEIAVELKYCNRCGANLTLPAANAPTMMVAPRVKLGMPSIVLGLTTIGGLGIIFGGASEFARVGVNPVAIVWMVLFSMATLFGCIALMIRFWTKLITLQRDSVVSEPVRRSFVEKPHAQQLPPRLEGIPSVTENTTRTFSPIYREPSDRGTG